jgi:hypothetical protein
MAQLDGDPLVACGDEEHGVAAPGAGVQFDKGVGHLQAFTRWLFRTGRRRDNAGQAQGQGGEEAMR